MKLKNKKEREQFVKNYKAWGVWKEIPELNIKLYRYDFNNGDCIIVTEFIRSKSAYLSEREDQKYHLVLTKETPYKSTYGQCYDYYEPSGCCLGTIIDYLTQLRNEIEVEE